MTSGNKNNYSNSNNITNKKYQDELYKKLVKTQQERINNLNNKYKLQNQENNIKDNNLSIKDNNNHLSQPDFNNTNNNNNSKNEIIEENNYAINRNNEKKKIIQNKLKFDDKSVLFGEKGIKCLYEQLIKENFREDKSDLDKLNVYMSIIKSWHFDLLSKYDFNYFTSKLTELGCKSSTKAYLQKLRHVYKGCETWENLLSSADYILAKTNKNKANEHIKINEESERSCSDNSLLEDNKSLNSSLNEENIEKVTLKNNKLKKQDTDEDILKDLDEDIENILKDSVNIDNNKVISDTTTIKKKLNISNIINEN